MQQADRMQPVEALDAGLALDLSGSWRFELDPDDVGTAQKWWRRSLAGEISLPGSLQAQGYGNDVTLDTPWVGLVRGGDWYNDPQYRPFQPEGSCGFPSGCSRKSTIWASPGTNGRCASPTRGQAGASSSAWSGSTGAVRFGWTTRKLEATTRCRYPTSMT